MSETRMNTGLVRFSYMQVLKPVAQQEGDREKYSCCLMVPKSDKKTVARIEKAIETAYQDGKATFGGKLPKSWKNPLRDGDEERDGEEFEGMYFLNASTIVKPGIVDKDLEQVMDPEKIYSGVWGRANVNFYAFNVNGNKGVACGLNHIQLLKDDEKLGGSSTSAENAFDDDFEYEEEDLF